MYARGHRRGPGGDGTTNLDASPGGGALHFYVWDTLADVGTKRYVRLDYVYTADGRVQVDGFGDPVFEALAGVRLRLRPIVDGVPGDWVYTDPFDVNNNNVPVVTVQGVVTPSPEGVVNEYVSLNWTGIDLDSDNVTISVDWSQIPAGYDPSGKTTDELAAELTWHACTGAPLGEGTLRPDGVAGRHPARVRVGFGAGHRDGQRPGDAACPSAGREARGGRVGVPDAVVPAGQLHGVQLSEHGIAGGSRAAHGDDAVGRDGADRRAARRRRTGRR